jgi:outer membrane protein
VLAFLTAADVQESPLVDQFDTPPALPTLEEMQQAGLESRRDLRAASAAVLAARQNVDAAFGQYYPSVRLSGDLFLYRESFPDERVWQGLLEANIPIFSAGLIHADVRQAWSQYSQAGMSESLLRRQVVLDVQFALQDLQSIEKRIGELEVQLAAAQQAFNQADQSYNVGLATNLERIAAQDQLLSAQLQITSARFDRTLGYLALARVTGRLRHRLETTTSGATTAPASAPATTM